MESPDGVLEILTPRADWPLQETIVAPGDGPLGRGARGALPFHLLYEARDLRLEPKRPVRWQLALRALGQKPENLQATEK